MSAGAAHIGREQTVTALDRTWRVARWSRAIWAEYLEWARGQIPDPVEVALKYIERLEPRLQDVCLCHALEMRNQYLAINSPDVQRLMGSFEGSVQLLYLLLKKYQPDVTVDEATEIAFELGQKEIKKAMERASGKVEGASPNSPAPAE